MHEVCMCGLVCLSELILWLYVCCLNCLNFCLCCLGCWFCFYLIHVCLCAFVRVIIVYVSHLINSIIFLHRMWDMSTDCLHNTSLPEGVKFLCCNGYSSKSCDVCMIWEALAKEIIVFRTKRRIRSFLQPKPSVRIQERSNWSQRIVKIIHPVRGCRHFCAMSCDYHVHPVLRLVSAWKRHVDSCLKRFWWTECNDGKRNEFTSLSMWD